MGERAPQQESKNTPEPGTEAKESSQNVLAKLESSYMALIGDKNFKAWEALNKEFESHRSLKSANDLPKDQQGEFLRKSAFIKCQIINLKYNPYGTLMGYKVSDALPSISRSDRIKDK